MSRPVSTKEFLKRLNIIHGALITAMVIFAVACFYFAGSRALDKETSMVFKYILVVLVPVGYIGGNFIFKKQVRSISQGRPLKEKLNNFQGASLIRSAALEVGGIFASLAAYISGDITNLLFTGVAIVLILSVRPTLESIIKSVPLSKKELALLESPDNVLYEQ